MLGRMPHLQGVLQDGHQLLDLAAVDDSCGDSSFGCQPFGAQLTLTIT